MTDPIKLCKRCGGCFQRKETGVRVCPHCGYDEVAEDTEKILSILGMEAPIVLPLNWCMTFMAAWYMMILAREDKIVRLFDEVTRFFLFSGSERLSDIIDYCAILTYADALVTGWFFQYQCLVRRVDLPLEQLKLLSIVGALNLICAVAAGMLIFYILGALELFCAVAFGTLLFYIVKKCFKNRPRAVLSDESTKIAYLYDKINGKGTVETVNPSKYWPSRRAPMKHSCLILQNAGRNHD